MFDKTGFETIDKGNALSEDLLTTENSPLRALLMPDLTGDIEYLSDLSEKDKPWDDHRANADTVQNLYRSAKYDRYADRIYSCSTLLEYAMNSNDEGDVAFRLQSAHFCRVRHCPVCQWRRSLKWQAKMFEAMPKIQEKYPTHRWLFLTLTVRNCDLVDLRTTVQDMNKAFIRLSQRKSFPAIGWIKSVEVTRNLETDQAHPHFHCLMLVESKYFGGRNYINQEEWRSLWQKCLRVNYLPIVNVKAVKPKGDNDISSAIVETFKYSVKESDLTSDAGWLVQLTNQLHKTRAISIGGVLRDFLREEKDDDDLVHVDEDNLEPQTDEGIKIHFGWKEAVKRYRKMDW
jgi:plasmid rolling circle replication initiator protein Rep